MSKKTSILPKKEAFPTIVIKSTTKKSFVESKGKELLEGEEGER